MTWIQVDGAGLIGGNRDLADHDLPPEAWTSLQNVRFVDDAAQKFKGYQESFGAVSEAPYFAMHTPTSTDLLWLYAGLDDVYGVQAGVHYNISKSANAYNATADDPWVGINFSGIPIINNPFDPPQMWTPVSSAQALVDLSNWPANTTCRSLRAFKQYLIALNVIEGANEYPYMVWWSHPADPGAVPSSWSYSDATVDAGRVDLAETPGFVMDSLPLGDVNIVYKEDSIWGMQHIGGQLIFRFYKISGQAGIMATRCAAQTPLGHVVLTPDDLVIHDGSSVRTLFDKRYRNYFFNNLNESRSSRCVVAAHPLKNEVWIAYPRVGQDLCTEAIVWNWEDNTIGERELPSIAHLSNGLFDPSSDTLWDADSEAWDDDNENWNARQYGNVTPELVGASPLSGSEALYQFDNGEDDNGADMTFTLERTGLAIVGRDRFGNWKSDFNTRKLVRGIRPKVESAAPINIFVGGQELKDGSVTWSGPFAFDPSTDSQIFCTVSTVLSLLLDFKRLEVAPSQFEASIST
jgi:hypothetical protein